MKKRKGGLREPVSPGKGGCDRKWIGVWLITSAFKNTKKAFEFTNEGNHRVVDKPKEFV